MSFNHQEDAILNKRAWYCRRQLIADLAINKVSSGGAI